MKTEKFRGFSNIQVFLIIFALGFVMVWALVPFVGATWYDYNYTNRFPIFLSTSIGTTPSNYQVPLNITYNSHMNSTFQDLIFVNSMDTNKLSYWIEDLVPNQWAKVWVNTSLTLNTTNQTIYLYYGNRTKTNESNGLGTFLIFDDFNDNSINFSTWEIYNQSRGYNISEYAGNYLTVQSTNASNSTELHSLRSFTTPTTTNGYVFRANVKLYTGSTSSIARLGLSKENVTYGERDGYNQTEFKRYGGSPYNQFWVGYTNGTAFTNGTGIPDFSSTFQNMTAYILQNNVTYYANNTLGGSILKVLPNENMRLSIGASKVNTYTGQVFVDWVYVADFNLNAISYIQTEEYAPITVINETYLNDSLELSYYTFNITLQKSIGSEITNPSLYYNNSVYNSGIDVVINGDNISYSKTVNIPYVQEVALAVNRTFYWSFNVTYEGVSHLQNSSTHNQTAHKMALNNLSSCTGDYALSFYNLSYKDEISETALTGINNTWNYELFNPENPSTTRNFNGSIDLSSHNWCNHYSTSNHYFNVRSLTSEIEKTNYTPRKDMVCEIANTTYIPQVQYLLLNTTDYQKFYFNVKDSYQANLINSYVYFYKWQSNQWLYLGSEKTDAYGNVVIRLVEDKSYKIVVKSDECEVLKEMELTLSCQALPCTVDIQLSESQNPYQYLDDLDGFIYTWDYNKNTKIEMFDYVYTGSDLNSVSFKTYKKSVTTGNTEVCSDSSSTSEDTFTCDVSNYSTGSFISYVYVTDDRGNLYTLTYTFDISNAPEIFGKEGLMWGILILVVLFFAFIFNPVAAIFATVVGMAVIAIMGLVALPWLFIVLIIVIAGIIIIKIKT